MSLYEKEFKKYKLYFTSIKVKNFDDIKNKTKQRSLKVNIAYMSLSIKHTSWKYSSK